MNMAQGGATSSATVITDGMQCPSLAAATGGHRIAPPGLSRTRTGRRRELRKRFWRRFREQKDTSMRPIWLSPLRRGLEVHHLREASSFEFIAIAAGVRRRLPHILGVQCQEAQKTMLMICDKDMSDFKPMHRLPLPLRDDIELDRKRLSRDGDDRDEWEKFCRQHGLDPNGTKEGCLMGFAKATDHHFDDHHDVDVDSCPPWIRSGIAYISEHFRKK